MPQLFFTSYAHINRDKVLTNFVQRLRDEVLQRGPGGLRPEDVVFFDSEGIQTGDQWVSKLSQAVSECKVCVAICSPAYTSSEFCGKEVQVFLQRWKDWEKQAGSTKVPKRSIIPVIWVKATLPEILNEFQYNEKEFPQEYLEHGLRTLCQLSKYKDKRKKIEITLAERIVAAAKSNLPPSGPIPHFDLIMSVFHEQEMGSPYGVALVPLVKGELSSMPYAGNVTLRNLMDDACSSRVPWRALAQDGKLASRISDAKNNREAIMVVADLATLGDPLYPKAVSAVDAAVGEQGAILIIGPEDQAALAPPAQDIGITVKGYFPISSSKVWYLDFNTIRSVETLRHSLEETITKMRTRLIQEDPAREVSDPKVVADAAAGGVPVERQPMLTGPGGKQT